MSASPPPTTDVYLLQNRANSFFTTASLEFTDSTLRCTLKQHAGWIEKELGITDLKQRIEAGENVVAFEFRRDKLNVKWLKQFLGGGFQVSAGDSRKWLVSLVYPTTIMSLWDAVEGRSAHKKWKQALASSATTSAESA
jgi:hypothetical protein